MLGLKDAYRTLDSTQLWVIETRLDCWLCLCAEALRSSRSPRSGKQFRQIVTAYLSAPIVASIFGGCIRWLVCVAKGT